MSVRRRLQVATVLIGAASGSSLGAGSAAAETADAGRGLAVAKKWCAACHLVSGSQKGPATDAAPTFGSIAANRKVSLARIRGILNNPHSKMPTNVLSRRDVNDIVEHFKKLRQP